MADIIVDIELTLVKPSLKGLTGSWTKYGGKRTITSYNQYGLSSTEKRAEWICQSCGQKQGPNLSPYLYEYPIGEFIRCCAVCLNDNCDKLKDRLLLISFDK